MRKFINLLMVHNNLFFREKQAVFWNFLFPLFLILFFGMIFGGDSSFGNFSLSVGYVDLDRSDASKQFGQIFEMVPVIKIKKGDRKELEARLRRGKLNYLIIIPENFKLGDGTYKPIELKYDPQQVNTNQIGFSMFDQIIYRMNRYLSDTEPMVSLKKSPVEAVKTRVRYIDWLVPGILAMSLLSAALFGIGVVIASEREKGQLRRFAVTPLPKSVYISTQTLQRFFIAVLQALVIIFVSLLVFNVKMKGSWLMLLVVVCVGLLAFSALGYALAARVKKAQTTAAVANVFFLPMMFLSGVYFPIEAMPSYLQPVAKALPLTYLNDAVRLVYAGNETFKDLLLPLVILSAWFIACFIIAVKMFVWE